MKLLKPDFGFNIIAAARAWPDSESVTNIDILKNFPRTAKRGNEFYQIMDKTIKNDLGFETRYWACKPWESLDDAIVTTESLAIDALKKIFQQQDAHAVDAFILGSTTTKRYTGSQAAAALGHFHISAPAFDIKAGCSTSLATLQLAYGLMSSGYTRVLVGAAETLSKVIYPFSENTWLGLADGAAIVSLEKDLNGFFVAEKIFFSTNGVYVDAYTTPATLPPTHRQIEEHGYCLQGDAALLKDLALSHYQQMIDKLLPTAAERAEITWVIPHQVNMNLIEHVLEKNQLAHTEVLRDSEKFGNIGGASILFTLARAMEEGIFNKKGKILMMSVGGGLSFAAQVIEVRPRK